MASTTPRIGLALSGGGFRASFFHVGVLTRLAELDQLRNVRVISCVSGGSVAGAVYYLSLLRKLMVSDKVEPETPPQLRDAPLTTSDYAACVNETVEVLTTIARGNVRARVFANPWKNVVMFLSPYYSRTDRAGDMIDKELRESFDIDTGFRFRWVANQLEMRSLHVIRPDLPRLVLNATTLNTGHAWRFDTDGMGEVLSDKRREVDKNDLLQWTPYEGLGPQANFPYAMAIAASAAFPGLFRPLPIQGVYDRRIDLMDGGAQDNQGIQSLLAPRPPSRTKPEIDRVIVSDGAGQLKDELTKARTILSVQRITGIQGDRIREEQLLAAKDYMAREGGVFELVDLRRDLPAADIAAQPPVRKKRKERPSDFSVEVRERLAELRTDLDAFGSLETKLLARRGYEVACATFGGPGPVQLRLQVHRTRDILAAASKQVAKPLAVYGATKVTFGLLGIVALGAAAWSIKFLAPDPSWRLFIRALMFILFFLAPAIASRALLHLGNPARWIKRLAGVGIYGSLLGTAGCLGPAVDRWGDAEWSHREALGIAAALLAAPAVLPLFLAVLFWFEGGWWKRLARLSTG